MSPTPPTLAIAGAGAAGTLTALYLVRLARRQGIPLRIVVLDPSTARGAGVAFGTTDAAHLLNVPASGMSALPDDPDHFARWCARTPGVGLTHPHAFVPRRAYAQYLRETLDAELREAAALVRVQHVRARVCRVDRVGPPAVGPRAAERWAVTDECGRRLEVAALVVATGLPATGSDWAPPSLRASARFVDDPWAPGTLEAVRRDRSGPPDVLVVGSGLTMVDVALTLLRPGGRRRRHLTAVSRSGRLPAVHAECPRPPVVPDTTSWPSDLAGVLEHASAHLRHVRRTTGDWRPGADGLRHRVGELWAGLDEQEREEFLCRHAGAWNTLRHRMPPVSAARIAELRGRGRLTVLRDRVTGASPLASGGLAVELASGQRREVGWVVSCTGPRSDIRELGNPLLDDLLRPRAGGPLAQLATAGMGVLTDDGRLRPPGAAAGAPAAGAPVWVVGALRRGELLESTAVPEIRGQAARVAACVLDLVGAGEASERPDLGAPPPVHSPVQPSVHSPVQPPRAGRQVVVGLGS